jgi:hypothetical protein
MGLLLSFFALAQIYDPAYRLFVLTFRLDGLPTHLPKPPLSMIIGCLFLLTVSAPLIFAGAKIIQFLGLCGQNLACDLVAILWR